MLLYTLFGAFFALMILIGLYFQNDKADSEAYFLGGRALGPYITAMSVVASDMSGWLLLGIPGLFYLQGISVTWILFGIIFGSFSCWLISAEHIRKSSKEFKSVTFPDLLSKLVEDKSGKIRLLAALISLVFLICYTSSGLVTSAKLFEYTLGVSYHRGLIFSAFCVSLYTSLGGYLAVSFTDMVQVTLVLVAMIALPVVLMLDGSFANVSSDQLHFLKTLGGQDLELVSILSMIFWGLGYFGQPHLLVRFKASKDSSVIQKARKIAFLMNLILLTSVTIIGILGFAYCQKNGVSISDPEKLVFILSNLVFHPAFSGVVSLAVLAAVMSTADSQLLVCSSCISEDIYKGNISKSKLGKISVLLIAMIAVALGWDPNSSVLDLVSYGWAGFGASFGPIILFSRFTQLKSCSAYASILVGSSSVILWKFFGSSDVYAIFPAFLASSCFVIFFKLVSFQRGLS